VSEPGVVEDLDELEQLEAATLLLGAAGSVLLRFSQSGGTDARSFHLAA